MENNEQLSTAEHNVYYKNFGTERIPFNAARYPDEDLKTYHLRRWNETLYFKGLLRGRLVWDSVKHGQYMKDAEKDKFNLNIVE